MSQLQFGISKINEEWVELLFPDEETYNTIHSIVNSEIDLPHACNKEKLTISVPAFEIIGALLRSKASEI